MADISSAPVKRLLVESSGGMRVGGSALNRAVVEAEGFLRSLGQAAGQCAALDKRKTIQCVNGVCPWGDLPRGGLLRKRKGNLNRRTQR